MKSEIGKKSYVQPETVKHCSMNLVQGSGNGCYLYYTTLYKYYYNYHTLYYTTLYYYH